MTSKEIVKQMIEFDFSTLTLPAKGACPVFYNLKTLQFEVWLPDTDIEVAEAVNRVLYIGVLSKVLAEAGGKPAYFSMDRLKMKLGEIL